MRRSPAVTPLNVDTLTLAEEPMDPFRFAMRPRSPTECWREAVLSASFASTPVVLRPVSSLATRGPPSAVQDGTGRMSRIIAMFDDYRKRSNVPTMGSLRSFSSALGARAGFRALWRRVIINVTCQEFTKLAFITSLPIFVVVLLCIQSLSRVRGQMDLIRQVQLSVGRSRVLAKLGDALKTERESVHEVPLSASRQRTDNVLSEAIDQGLPASFVNFSQELEELRSMTRANFTDFGPTQDWYMIRGAELSAEAGAPFVASGQEGRFWATVYAYNAVLKAKDQIGLERAIGSGLFARGDLDLETYKCFAMHNGAADALLLKARSILYPQIRNQFQNIVSSEPQLMSSVYHYLDLVFANQTQQVNTSDRSELALSGRYFSYLTGYINLVTSAESMLTEVMLSTASQESKSRKLEFGVTLSLVAASLIICPALVFWYAFSNRRMMLRIRSYMEELGEQKQSIISERKNADFLLHQMLPRQIVFDIKNSRPVCPQGYDEATVYFCVVDQFTEIADRLLPYQIVDLLNQLYSKLDFILDQYDAYKVETSGGTYMIASGLPARNGHKHSSVICSLALHTQAVVETDFTPPHEIGRLHLRSGIHTGHVVAGVVGLKNTRYCLFGDTVNVASRMMSTGIARRIQLSAVTRAHLEKHHKGRFSTKLRGVVTMKGRWPLTSYWLIGKKNFPFTIDQESDNEDTNTMPR